MILDRSLHPVDRAMHASTLFPRDGIVLVAASGGADSMALLEALRTIAASRALSLVVAHFDHQLREDSARDAEHVAAYACAHGLEFVLGSEDVAARARSQHLSIEEAARNARYEFLASAAQRVGATCVATAHTRSDQIETVLMRIVRGTGLAGGAGIPARRGGFVRPLLEVTRADTRGYCESRGVTFVDDPSNDDPRFFRNRVRHEILPALRALYPSIDAALLRIAEFARRENEAFAVRTDGWLQTHARQETDGAWALHLTGFDAVEDDDARSLLREALVNAGLARDVGRVHYERLLELVRNTRAGASADLPGFSARREHDALVLRCTSEHSSAEVALLQIPGSTRAGEWTIHTAFVSADHARQAIAAPPNADVAYFDADALSEPLRARPLRAGDAMRPLGLGGRKKLSDLFIDRKVPRRRRERAIAIEGESIYWVPGVARSDAGRIDERTTRVVRMEALRAEELS